MMQTWKVAISVVGTLLLAGAAMAQSGAQSGAQPATRPDMRAIKHGGGLAKHYCSVCHAIGPLGDSPNPLSPPFRELGRRYPLDDLQESLVEGIVSGHPAMPQFVFQAADANDLVAYLKSIQVPAAPKTSPSATVTSH